MKYVITGASTYGVKNMGDDAMLANLVQGLKREDKNAQIIFIARHPDKEYDKLFGFESIKNLDHDSNKEASGRFFLGFNNGDATDNLQTIKKHIETADLLIIGGNSFMEVSENEFLRGVSTYATTLAVLAKFCGTPYALFGVNVVSSIRNNITKQHSKFLIENAIMVTVREKEVIEYLKKLDINLCNVIISEDPAFGMTIPRNQANSRNILKREQIKLNKNKKVVTVGYRLEYWDINKTVVMELITKLAVYLDWLISYYDFQILFIPNCTYTKGNEWEDDRLVHRLIIEKINAKEDVFAVESDLNVYETYKLFKISYFHLSNRRHSNAFAAMNRIPFLSMHISLDSQISGLLEALQMPNLSISLKDDISVLVKKTEYLLNNYLKISRKLENMVSLISESSKNNVAIILKELKNKT